MVVVVVVLLLQLRRLRLPSQKTGGRAANKLLTLGVFDELYIFRVICSDIGLFISA